MKQTSLRLGVVHKYRQNVKPDEREEKVKAKIKVQHINKYVSIEVLKSAEEVMVQVNGNIGLYVHRNH